MYLLFKSTILYGSYLVFPFIAFLWYVMQKFKHELWLKAILFASLFPSFLFVYIRFVEPQLITVNRTRIDVGFKAKVILISDLHLGMYKHENYLRRVVSKTNSICDSKDCDAVLIAGDLTHWPKKDELVKLFTPLKSLKIPVYTVLGNHDVGRPGPEIRSELEEALQANNVKLLNNEAIKLKEYYILGLGDMWNHESDVRMLEQFKSTENVIVLAHHPEVIHFYSGLGGKNADITLSGHCHGGQLKIPYIYKLFLPCEPPFEKGLYDIKGQRVFVSSGLGETGFPIRLRVPPVVEVLELY